MKNASVCTCSSFSKVRKKAKDSIEKSVCQQICDTKTDCRLFSKCETNTENKRKLQFFSSFLKRS